MKIKLKEDYRVCDGWNGYACQTSQAYQDRCYLDVQKYKVGDIIPAGTVLSAEFSTVNVWSDSSSDWDMDDVVEAL